MYGRCGKGNRAYLKYIKFQVYYVLLLALGVMSAKFHQAQTETVSVYKVQFVIQINKYTETLYI